MDDGSFFDNFLPSALVDGSFFCYFLPSAVADDSFFCYFLPSALADDSFYSLPIDFHLVHGNPQNDELIIMAEKANAPPKELDLFD